MSALSIYGCVIIALTIAGILVSMAAVWLQYGYKRSALHYLREEKHWHDARQDAMIKAFVAIFLPGMAVLLGGAPIITVIFPSAPFPGSYATPIVMGFIFGAVLVLFGASVFAVNLNTYLSEAREARKKYAANQPSEEVHPLDGSHERIP